MSSLRFMFGIKSTLCSPYTPILKQIMNHGGHRSPQPKVDRDKAKTAVLMVYTGGPKCEEDIECFVQRVLKDEFLLYGCKSGKSVDSNMIMQELRKRYAAVGNRTPQFGWMQTQATLIEERLDAMCVSTFPHKTFLGCQFVKPSIFDALREIQKLQCLENILILPMYPQYSCGLTGSCFNTIFRFYKKNPLPEGVRWSVVDSWATTYSLIKNTAYLIRKALQNCDMKKKPYVLIFGARPMPPLVFDVGDFYPFLVGATILHVMRHVGDRIDFSLGWHHGNYLDKWMEPTIEEVISDYVCQGRKWFMLVPISTIVENLITYVDYDIKLQKCFLPKLGNDLHLTRIEAPNASELFISSVSKVCKDALTLHQIMPPHMREMCVLCQNKHCAKYKKWFRALLTERRVLATKTKEEKLIL